MGWFRRDSGSDDEFYRGDAPVLMPGVDGEAPSAYRSPTAPPAPPVPDRYPSGPAAGFPAAPGPPPGAPAAPGYPAAQASGAGSPPWAGSADTPLAFPPTGAPAYPPPGSPPYQPPGYPDAPGSVVPPPYPRPAAPDRAARRVGLGCAVVLVLSVLLGIGGVILVAVISLRASLPGDDPAPETVIGAIDVPSTVSYDGTDVRVTVGGAQAQPGSGWQWSRPDPQANLVIAVSLLQQSRPLLTIPFTDWSFQPDDRAAADPVQVNFISGFEPELSTASLTNGETTFGYLSFETPSTSGTLVLEGDYGDPPLATWQISGTPVAVGIGSVGVPVRPQIGLPPFTVTLDTITWVDPAAEIVRKPPASGSYLVADLTLTSTGAVSSGIIEHEQFVFIPAGGTEVPSVTTSIVQDTTSITSVIGGSSVPVRVAFDVPVGPGTLELRNGSGRPIVSWVVE